MNVPAERELADRIVQALPADEEELHLKLGISREHCASLCTHLLKEKRIRLDRSWDEPRHWRAA